MSKDTITEIRLNSLINIKKHLLDYQKLMLRIEKDQKARIKLKVNDGFELLEVTGLIDLITCIEKNTNEDNVVL